MGLSLLECLFYGLISGFSEFLPVSSVAHQTVFLKLLGADNDPWLRFFACLGGFLAGLFVYAPTLLRLQRERRIAAAPKKRRRRQPDFASLMEARVLITAGITMLVLFLAYSLVSQLHQRLWILAIFLVINGIIVYVPQYLPGANKTAQSLSGLDALLIGLAAGSGIIPGVSRVGAALSVAKIRGADRRYASDLSMMLAIPALLLLSVICLFAALPSAISGALMLRGIIVLAASFFAAYFAIFLMRFLAVRIGYGAFAYYSWGAALFVLIIYLI